MNYYNEFDKFAAQWLRELIKAGSIPKGYVDERPIQEVKPDDLKEFTQCHFFAGIGGWSYALQLAWWPEDRPVWTGSCPCQPFSTAGNRKGKKDGRHLWPVWFELIRERRPATIFGEQVASAIAHGWLDDVYQGLESEGYACGAAVLPACSVGAPHKRDRLFFVGDMQYNGSPCGSFKRSDGTAVCDNTQRQDSTCESEGTSKPSNVANRVSEGLQGHRQPSEQSIQEMRQRAQRYPWEGGVWIDCPDGKQRLVEPSIPLLAHGIPRRVGRLRGYGNAIVPQVAAEFIKAYMEI